MKLKCDAFGACQLEISLKSLTPRLDFFSRLRDGTADGFFLSDEGFPVLETNCSRGFEKGRSWDVEEDTRNWIGKVSGGGVLHCCKNLDTPITGSPLNPKARE